MAFLHICKEERIEIEKSTQWTVFLFIRMGHSSKMPICQTMIEYLKEINIVFVRNLKLACKDPIEKLYYSEV